MTLQAQYLDSFVMIVTSEQTEFYYRLMKLIIFNTAAI